MKQTQTTFHWTHHSYDVFETKEKADKDVLRKIKGWKNMTKAQFELSMEFINPTKNRITDAGYEQAIGYAGAHWLETCRSVLHNRLKPNTLHYGKVPLGSISLEIFKRIANLPFAQRGVTTTKTYRGYESSTLTYFNVKFTSFQHLPLLDNSSWAFKLIQITTDKNTEVECASRYKLFYDELRLRFNTDTKIVDGFFHFSKTIL